MYAVVLDANVLVPTALCDTLLRLAEDGFYRPLWSERILLEVEHAVLGLYPDIDPARVRPVVQESGRVLPLLHVHGFHIAFRRLQRREDVEVTVTAEDEDGSHGTDDNAGFP